MRWLKKGLIYRPDGSHEWMASHAYVPVVDALNEQVLRIYFGTRSRDIKTVTTFIDVDASDPSHVLYVHDRPVLGLGRLGTFDDGGALCSSLVNYQGKKYMFYVGWNASVTVPYRNAIGLAISEDGGHTFIRACEGPIVDRNQYEPFFTASPCAMREDGEWKLWYASSTGWEIVQGRPEPVYQIKYATSRDAIHWDRPNITCIPYKSPGEANARPTVLKERGIYRMWYCYRGSKGYRTEPSQSYRIGYAESETGTNWTRLDDEAGIERSESGWDSVMLAYPCVYSHAGRKYLFYNGNGFGESGVGFAVLMSDKPPFC
jgi:hypothetical protein